MTVHVPFAISGHTHSWALDAAKLALRQDGVEVAYHYLGADDAYYVLLRGLWHAGGGFVIVEHDIVVWPGAVQQLEDCPEPWCVFPYYSSVGWARDALGCTKFSSGLLQRYPDVLEPPFPDCCQHTTYWCGLDRLISHRLRSHGLEPHEHSPAVVNLNDRWT